MARPGIRSSSGSMIVISGSAPGSPRQRRPHRCRRAARASPDRPRDRRPSPTGRRGAAGASRCSRASASASRSPRLPVAKAWISSMTTVFRFGEQQQRCPGGSAAGSAIRAWSAASAAAAPAGAACGRTGVSPVRVSTRIGRPISSIGVEQVALDVDRERLERRHVERVEPVGRAARRGRRSSGGSPRASFPRRSPRPAARFARAARDRAFRAGGAAAASLSTRTSVERLGEGRSEVVSPLAPADFFLGVEVARRLLGAAGFSRASGGASPARSVRSAGSPGR